MSCNCECPSQAELENMFSQLSEENKSIQKSLVQIRLILDNLTTKKEQEIIRQRERRF